MLARDTEAHDAYCENSHPSDDFADTAIVRAASPLSQLTPALGREQEVDDTRVVDAECTSTSHEALKQDAVQWALLEYRGIQLGYGGPDQEMRNCTCGSSLCKDLPPLVAAKFWLCASTHEIRIEFTDGSSSVFAVERGDGQLPQIDGHDDEELALVAWNALGLADCDDPRFAGWDADSWKAFDAAWAAKSEAA